MTSGSPSTAPDKESLLRSYWRRNVRTMAALLCVWAAVGLGAGILFADRLNAYTLPGTGFPLGFWFAQQGSIISFVLLILVYCLLMNRSDEQHHREMQQVRNGDSR